MSDEQPAAKQKQSEVEQSGLPVGVVGIGASAGGLAVLKTFFALVPEDSALAFVVVVHLSPEHESILADLLQPHARIPVQQVSQTTRLEANRVYVIPPNANLSAVDTHLRLSELEPRRQERAPIDHFFRTLARTHDGHSIGVILTGTGSDGTLGIKAIKENNGLTIVQDPAEAEFDGMPQSAIATGLVDLVLPLEQIPAAILRFAHTEPKVDVPQDEEDLQAEPLSLLQTVFAQLLARTGRDFSRYKLSTILRRIQRRMQMCHIEEISAYVDLLREQPDEVHALADDLLITVTHFFRDPEMFEELEHSAIAQLFAGKGAGDHVRVWSVGCATGEEAYSLAILLLEACERHEVEHGMAPRLQLFASDLHKRSLERAREGFYPGDIEADVSAQRLQRFFHQEDGGYRVKKELRDMVLFTPHNLLGDPPFSKIDLIACRNVLIYLQRAAQREVIDLFHYALKPDGFLVLGTSESVDSAELFRVEDKNSCIYRKRSVPRRAVHLPVFPPPRTRFASTPERPERANEPVAYGALHQQMVERYAPPSLLVSPDDKVVHFSERAGRYLIHPGGEATMNVFKLVRVELRVELRAALHAVREQGRTMRTRPIPVRFNEESSRVVLDVSASPRRQEEGFVVVIFDERPGAVPGSEAPDRAAPLQDDPRASELEAELHLTWQRMQTLIEQHETSQEELTASNEELQSANEELRSTLEELETSKEELQSMNEELHTVNQENRHKVEELSQLTSDLQNFMAATQIATLFLDHELRIMRYTPQIGELFNIRPADHGRPLSDLTHRLRYDALDEDARHALATRIPIEREVQDEEGCWYLTRVLTYRSRDARIEGVVITFVDITQRKEVEEELHKSDESLRTLNLTLVQRNEQVQQLATSLTLAEQEERRRISQILHDDLQQILYSQLIRLSLLQDKSSEEAAALFRESIDQVQEEIKHAIEITRTLVTELNPPVLQDDGLPQALEWLAEHMRQLHGLNVQVTIQEACQPQNRSVRALLIQMTRELLFNVVKHSGVGEATLRLERAGDNLLLHVEDRGCGFDAAAVTRLDGSDGGFGLYSVRERLQLVGGSMEIASISGEGSRITLVAPCKEDTTQQSEEAEPGC